MAQFKAIRTEYKGIEFRSKLEARYAIGFDRFDIKWIYEPKAFAFADGRLYTPDFYLPDLGIYFEVKGRMSADDYSRIETFSKQTGNTIVIGHPEGNMTIYDTGGRGTGEVFKCAKCGGVYFACSERGWQCRRCGAYDGDGHIAWMDLNFFNAVDALSPSRPYQYRTAPAKPQPDERRTTRQAAPYRPAVPSSQWKDAFASELGLE